MVTFKSGKASINPCATLAIAFLPLAGVPSLICQRSIRRVARRNGCCIAAAPRFGITLRQVTYFSRCSHSCFIKETTNDRRRHNFPDFTPIKAISPRPARDLIGYSANQMKTPTRQKARKKEWFDNESFWRELYPFMFSDRRFADATDQVAKLLKLAKPRGKSALDLCCGPGRCSIALAKRGFSVIGVDRTKFLLAKARAKARAARVKIEFLQQDMRDFLRPNSFNLALSMFTSFGYFDDKHEDQLVLQNIYKSLKPGGVCVIELLGKERLAKMLQPTNSTTLPNGTVIIER